MTYMEVRDAAAWGDQLTEFEADDLSRKFKDYLVFWVETTEKLLVEEFPLHAGKPDLPVRDCLSKALQIAEQTMGFLAVEWIAQMLLVMTEHWTRGEQLYDQLSYIEKRLVEQATAMKLVDLQMAASMPTEE